MPAKFPTGKVKYVTAPLGIPIHKRLVEIAQEREITLDQLLRKLCEWASTKTGPELISVGVNLPVYAQDTRPAAEVTLPE